MKKIILTILIIFTEISFASTFHILISSDENAPTPEFIVNESLISPPPPSYTLNAFNTATPTTVKYLIKSRASGHLRVLMDNNPNWERAQLQQYLSVTYPEGMGVSNIQASLDNDQYVTYAYQIDEDNLPTLSVPFPDLTKSNLKEPISSKNTTLVNINGSDIQDAWELSEGMGYVGIADTGLQINHPNLRAFDELGSYEGGNLLDSYYQIDFAKSSGIDLNVDELEPIPATGGFTNCDVVDGDPNDGLTQSSFVGHGTHVSGLIGAKGGLAPGICKNCGISMMKFYGAEIGFCYLQPDENKYYMLAGFDYDAYLSSWEVLANSGVGVANLSAGSNVLNQNTCRDAPLRAECKTIKLMDDNQVMFVGAAGNNRKELQFPSNDDRTAAAGGIDEVGNFWNESPDGSDYTSNNNLTNCPQVPSGWLQLDDNEECGSNFSYGEIDHSTDVITQSRNVYSIFYEGQEHNPLIQSECTDAFDGTPNDGYGLCTGTSMSAPQTSAIFQLMRSAIPLLPNGNYDPNNLIGLRNVLNATAQRSTNSLGHNKYFGYGEPSARKALEMIIGKSNGIQLKTRLTPMFVIHSIDAKNTAYTPFPQIAVTFLSNTFAEYLPDTSADLIDEFDEFWSVLSFPSPRAAFYVFTTNNNPFVNLKNMVPLRRMEKTSSGINRNDTYAVNDTEIQDFHDDGYNIAGIEGYIYPTCLAEPSCIPANMQKLYRVVDDVNFNHTLVNLPVNDPAPANSTKLGYVFPNIDSDGDGLIDGQERILGTSMSIQDTDGDGLLDGIEYPPAGVPFSDPLISDIIFEDGFE